MATKKETIQSAMLSKCGGTLPYKKKKRTFAGYHSFSGDPKTIAIRTLRPVRICNNSGLHIVKTNHELQN